jgi:rRNA maturation protein Nop10
MKIKKTLAGTYTLDATDKFGQVTFDVIPPKYAPQDPHGILRRKAKLLRTPTQE